MVIHIDARRLTDATALHAAVSEAFGFPHSYGNNLDAMVDCLTHLDDPKAGMSRVHVLPGQVILLAVEHTAGASKAVIAHVRGLVDAVAFVNWRRFERKQSPVLAVAYAAV
jgi:hypothetical protein